jgi:hypothetical protein
MAEQKEHVNVARLQGKIREHLGLAPDKVIFDYRTEGADTVLDLITINPVHEQSFLFKTVKGRDRVEVLERALDYVESYKEKESSYTLQWCERGDKDLQTSYFRGANLYDVLHKFYYGRDPSSIVIYSVLLSPVS